MPTTVPSINADIRIVRVSDTAIDTDNVNGTIDSDHDNGDGIKMIGANYSCRCHSQPRKFSATIFMLAATVTATDGCVAAARACDDRQ